ncbi:hypothetical protein TrRE_jg9211 [Triparma retinervis]|uniref:protein-tyrosine-phosphatase n=1 Tax=Triparma retinervis TaxID=2557542 RepID=A0A9W7DSM1_9STRA|nr:hypothetical protein TrRE_jg9211 [Triparma retinervis]
MSRILRDETSGNCIFIGGKADAKSIQTIKENGITHILNVTPTKDSGLEGGLANFFERSSVVGNKLVYKRIPVMDIPGEDLKAHASAAVKFIKTGLFYGSVLVHCRKGQSRSCTCACFYLIKERGMTAEEALGVCREGRPGCNPIESFVRQLKEYQVDCGVKEGAGRDPPSTKS